MNTAAAASTAVDDDDVYAETWDGDQLFYGGKPVLKEKFIETIAFNENLKLVEHYILRIRPVRLLDKFHPDGDTLDVLTDEIPEYFKEIPDYTLFEQFIIRLCLHVQPKDGELTKFELGVFGILFQIIDTWKRSEYAARLRPETIENMRNLFIGWINNGGDPTAARISMYIIYLLPDQTTINVNTPFHDTIYRIMMVERTDRSVKLLPCAIHIWALYFKNYLEGNDDSARQVYEAMAEKFGMISIIPHRPRYPKDAGDNLVSPRMTTVLNNGRTVVDIILYMTYFCRWLLRPFYRMDPDKPSERIFVSHSLRCAASTFLENISVMLTVDDDPNFRMAIVASALTVRQYRQLDAQQRQLVMSALRTIYSQLDTMGDVETDVSDDVVIGQWIESKLDQVEGYKHASESVFEHIAEMEIEIMFSALFTFSISGDFGKISDEGELGDTIMRNIGWLTVGFKDGVGFLLQKISASRVRSPEFRTLIIRYPWAIWHIYSNGRVGPPSVNESMGEFNEGMRYLKVLRNLGHPRYLRQVDGEVFLNPEFGQSLKVAALFMKLRGSVPMTRKSFRQIHEVS